MTAKERITRALTEAFQPDQLDVIDESGLHAGHNVEAATRGETHFRVRLVSPAFAGLTRLERHRRINTVLADELAGGVHALAIEADAPRP